MLLFPWIFSQKEFGLVVFYPLEKLHCLGEGYRKAFSVAGQPLLLLETKGRRYLLKNRCPHAGHPLLESTLQDEQLRCPLHGIQFSLQSGMAVNVNNLTPEQCLSFYTLVYRDNQIGVEL